MQFSEILGQEHLKKHLQTATKNGRVPHAQLFVGKEGAGTLPMAIAYAQHLLHSTSNNPEESDLKCSKLQHPDLHFSFPVATNDLVKKHPVSNLFLSAWRTFVKEQPYGGLYNWYQHIGIEKKQGKIGVDEAAEIVKKLYLKSYEGGYKVLIIWMAEKMNTAAANKLLKLLEEPPQKTIFLLVTENEEQLLHTIRSRCQALHFPVLSSQTITDALVAREGVSVGDATKIAHQSAGNYNKALQIYQNNASDLQYETWFITWIRAAFKARGNAAVIEELIQWSDAIAKEGRETQKKFLHYCLQFFRQALLLNYKAPGLVFLETKTPGFQLDKFAPFIHSGNILAIEKEVNDALYHIERNGNAKIILLDASIKLTRLLHTKEEVVSPQA